MKKMEDEKQKWNRTVIERIVSKIDGIDTNFKTAEEWDKWIEQKIVMISHKSESMRNINIFKESYYGDGMDISDIAKIHNLTKQKICTLNLIMISKLRYRLIEDIIDMKKIEGKKKIENSVSINCKEDVDTSIDKVMNTPIYKLGLSTRALNALVYGKYTTVESVIISLKDNINNIMTLKGMGTATFTNLLHCLDSYYETVEFSSEYSCNRRGDNKWPVYIFQLLMNKSKAKEDKTIRDRTTEEWEKWLEDKLSSLYPKDDYAKRVLNLNAERDRDVEIYKLVYHDGKSISSVARHYRISNDKVNNILSVITRKLVVELNKEYHDKAEDGAIDIIVLNLSTRARNKLYRNGFTSVQSILTALESNPYKIICARGLGPKTYAEMLIGLDMYFKTQEHHYFNKYWKYNTDPDINNN